MVSRLQRALGTLRPAVVEEFLGAVEGLGAFYCGLQLRDLELLSRSVRSQWEVGAFCLESNQGLMYDVGLGLF